MNKQQKQLAGKIFPLSLMSAVQKFQVDRPSQSERDLLLNSTHLNSIQPRIAPAFGLIPEILPEWLKFIWDAIGNNDVST